MQKSNSNFNKNVSHSAKTSQDVKGKGKIVSEPDAPFKRSEANPKIVGKKVVKKQIQNKQKKPSTKDVNSKYKRITVF